MTEQGSTDKNAASDQKRWYYWLGYNLFSRMREAIRLWIANHKMLAISALVLLLVFLFLDRPILHPLALGLRKYFLLVLILSALLWILLRKYGRAGTLKRAVIILLFSAITLLAIAYGRQVYEYVGMYIHYSIIEKVSLETLPTTDFERIQSFESINTLVNQEALSETEDATPARLIRGADGRQYFSMSVGPSAEYLLQQLTRNQGEIIATPATLPAPDFSSRYRTETHFNVGELLLFSHHYINNVIRTFNALQFFSFEPSHVTFIERAPGDWVQVVSLIEWKGWLIPRPVFGGVVVIEPGEMRMDYLQRVIFGKGHLIDAAEIPEYPWLRAQDLLPVRVSRYIADCFRFQSGFFAPMPGYHEKDIRIPILPDDQMQQPFVMYFKGLPDSESPEGGLYHYFGLEPYQEDKRGLNTSVILAADGASPVYYMDHAERNDSYIGASAVGFKVKESRKNYDWTLNLPAETRPYIHELNGETRLFWLSTIVTATTEASGATEDGTGSRRTFGGSIPDVCITDARTGNVVWLEKDIIPDQQKWLEQIQREMQNFW